MVLGRQCPMRIPKRQHSRSLLSEVGRGRSQDWRQTKAQMLRSMDASDSDRRVDMSFPIRQPQTRSNSMGKKQGDRLVVRKSDSMHTVDLQQTVERRTDRAPTLGRQGQREGQK